MQLPGEFSSFIEKKVVFCLVVGGVTPLPHLSGPTPGQSQSNMQNNNTSVQLDG